MNILHGNRYTEAEMNKWKSSPSAKLDKLKAALLQFCNEYEEYMKDTDGVSWRVVVADEVRNILAENT